MCIFDGTSYFVVVTSSFMFSYWQGNSFAQKMLVRFRPPESIRRAARGESRATGGKVGRRLGQAQIQLASVSERTDSLVTTVTGGDGVRLRGFICPEEGCLAVFRENIHVVSVIKQHAKSEKL